MNASASEPRRWMVSVRVHGELLTASARMADAEAVFVAPGSKDQVEEAQDWLRDLIAMAIESAKGQPAARPVPLVLNHLMTGLLFSHAELWSRPKSAAPFSMAFVRTPGEVAFGWVGEPQPDLWIDDHRTEVEWVRIRDHGGREARALSLADTRRVRVHAALTFPSPAGAIRGSIDAAWVPEPADEIGAEAGRSPSMFVRAFEVAAETAAPTASPAATEPAPAAAEAAPARTGPGPDWKVVYEASEANAVAAAPTAIARGPDESPRGWWANLFGFFGAGRRREVPVRASFEEPLPEPRVTVLEMGDLETEAEPGSEATPGAEPAPAPIENATGVAVADRPATPAAAESPDPRAPGSPGSRTALPDLIPPTPEPPALTRRAVPAPSVPGADALLAELAAASTAGFANAEPDLDEVARRNAQRSLELMIESAALDEEGDAPIGPARLAETPPAWSEEPSPAPASIGPPPLPPLPRPSATPRPVAAPAAGSAPPWTAPAAAAPPIAASAPEPVLAPPPLPAAAPPIAASAPEPVLAPPPLPAAPPPITASAPEPALAPPPLPAAPPPIAASAPEPVRDALPPAPAAPIEPPVAAAPPIEVAAPEPVLAAPPPTASAPPIVLPVSAVTPMSVPEPVLAAPPSPAPAPPLASPVAATPAPPAPAPLAPAPPLPDAPSPPAFVAAPAVPPRDEELATAPAPARDDGASRPPARVPMRPQWPAPETGRLAPGWWSRPWIWVVMVVLLFAGGWYMGGLQPEHEVGNSGVLSRSLRALGLGGARFDVTIQSRPTGAWIAVNGKDLARRTPASIDLPAGIHQIDLSFSDLGSARFEVRGARGDRVALDAPLWGSLTVYASDNGIPVNVEVDGVARGLAPVTVDSLPPGAHDVRFSGPGLLPWGQTVQVRVKEEAKLVARPVTSPATGVLEVRAKWTDTEGTEDLTGATVFIDGEKRGVTPLTLELPRGPHSARVESRGESSPVQVIDLPGGNQRFATFELGLLPERPHMEVLGVPIRVQLDQPTVISTVLFGATPDEIREMWLHVRQPDGAWRRYEMEMMRSPTGVVGTAVFPNTLLDAHGQTVYYCSATSQTGDDSYTEVLVATEAAPDKK